jgi:DNA-binding CsgD family transcriptional regulator
MDRWAATRGVSVVQLYARHARGLAALGRGEFDAAYAELVAINAPGELPQHVPLAVWSGMDLVLAAVRTGRFAEATAHAEIMGGAPLASVSTRFALAALGSAAIAAREDPAAMDLFERALAIDGIDAWPFDLARVRLAYGERLRRARDISQARTHLDAALEAFTWLGALPWASRAGNELRAAGPAQRSPRDASRSALSPQEREIAELAATGLTNKQIGARLGLSPRTVGGHLYRVYPKLGITSRAVLREALESARGTDDRP